MILSLKKKNNFECVCLWITRYIVGINHCQLFLPAMYPELTVGSSKPIQHVSQGHGIVTGPHAEQAVYIPLPTPPPNIPAHGVSRADFAPEARHVAVKMNQQDPEQTNTYYGGAMTAMAIHGVKVTSVLPSFLCPSLSANEPIDANFIFSCYNSLSFRPESSRDTQTQRQ